MANLFYGTWKRLSFWHSNPVFGNEKQMKNCHVSDDYQAEEFLKEKAGMDIQGRKNRQFADGFEEEVFVCVKNRKGPERSS